MICKSNLQLDGALCYPQCASGYYGVGPVCWTSCDSNQFSCAAACAEDESTCAWSTLDLVTSPLILAFNIGTMGMGAPVTGAATVTVKTASGAARVVSGTTKVGKALVTFANAVKTTGGKAAVVVKRVTNSKTGKNIELVKKGTEVLKQVYETGQAFRSAFSDDFATQTSTFVNDEINRRYHPTTASYIKRAWADVHYNQLASAYGWQGADIALNTIAIFDPTGVTGVVAAYAKPICQKVIAYPCTSFDLTCSV
jgi:hypothetical protein